MDFSNLSLQELLDLEQQIKAAIASRRDTDIAAAKQQVLALAQSLGISVQELVAGVREKGGKAGKTGKGNGTVAVRYQHPEDASKTWTGRGRSPHWVKEWTDSGKSLDQLHVK